MTPRSVLRTLVVLLAVGLFVCASAMTVAYFYLRSSVQALGGQITVAGLQRPVDIVVDSLSVPHIFAEDEYDLFFAQGFVHASERLWQMEMFRRVAQGRLAEVFGEPALGADRFLRTLGLWRAAEKSLLAMGPEARRVLEAYSNGVNAGMASRRGPPPPEFVLLGITPEPWEPIATVAIGKVMALDLSAWRSELGRFYARAVLPAEKAAYLPPAYPDWGATIIGDSVELPFRPSGRAGERGPSASGPRLDLRTAEPVPTAAMDRAWREAYEILSRMGFRASNAWAVGRERAAHAGSLLANDMHLGLEAPSQWYLESLHSASTDYHVAGLSLPGVPGIVVGYNRHVAWGFSNGMTDDMDFAIEQPSLDSSAYRKPDGWQLFEVDTVEIQVRGRSEPVMHAVRRTERGPVITDVLPPLGATLSVLWVAAHGSTEIDGLLGMNRATDADAFDAAVQRFDSPQQNVVYATSEGTIGYRLSGTVPRHGDFDGSMPVEADRIGDWWGSFWPPGSLPSVRDPEDGFIATANNLQAPNLFGLLGRDYAPPFRAGRIRERLTAGSSWTWEQMAALQLDTHSGLADRVGALAAAAARRAGEDSAAVLLEAWDREVTLDSRAAGLFYAWFYRLRALVAADEYADQPWSEFPTLTFLRILEERGGPWVDDVRTEPVETLPLLEEAAIRDAVRATGYRRWGEIHFEQSVHTLGRSPWIQRVLRFNIGPYPTPGGPNTVRPDDYGRWTALDSTSWTPPYVGDYGPSERFVAEMSEDASTGYFLLPTGESGNPFSPSYRDMAARWAEPRLIPVPLERARAEARAVRVARLLPAPPRTGRG